MGCTFDMFNVDYFPSGNHTKVFSEIYNEKLEDSLYWGEDSFLDENSFTECLDGYCLEVEDEPLFNVMDNGNQLVDVILEYVARFPEDEFSADYCCTFSNCGAIFMTDYRYEGDRRLVLEHRCSESEALSYCGKCGSAFYDEPICRIEDYEEGDIYYCPKCGAQFNWDVDIWEEVYELKNGEWESLF